MKFELESQNDVVGRTEIIILFERYNYLKDNGAKILSEEHKDTNTAVELFSIEYENNLKAFISGLRVIGNAELAFFSCDLLIACTRIWEVCFLFAFRMKHN